MKWVRFVIFLFSAFILLLNHYKWCRYYVGVTRYGGPACSSLRLRLGQTRRLPRTGLVVF